MSTIAARRLYRSMLSLSALLCLVAGLVEWLVFMPFRNFYFPEQRDTHDTLWAALPLAVGVLCLFEAASLLLYRRFKAA